MNQQRQGRKVRWARAAKGMSQAELAQALGRPPTAISALEQANRPPRLTYELIMQLSDVLDISPHAFFPSGELLRGRISNHWLHLGVDRSPEALVHSLADVHRLHPDIIGLTLFQPDKTSGDLLGVTASIETTKILTRTALDLEFLPPLSKQAPKEGDYRIRPQRRSNTPVPIDEPVEVQMTCGAGALCILVAETPEGDEELPTALWHLADAIAQAISILRGRDKDVAELQQRIARLENDKKDAPG